MREAIVAENELISAQRGLADAQGITFLWRLSAGSRAEVAKKQAVVSFHTPSSLRLLLPDESGCGCGIPRCSPSDSICLLGGSAGLIVPGVHSMTIRSEFSTS